MPGGRPALEIRRLGPDLVEPLSRFFADLDASGAERFFHPHRLSTEEAKRFCNYQGDDLFYVVMSAGHVLGYGMLRGWDEGYETPSLGIALHPNTQGKKFGKMLMMFLHAAARHRGAERIRLTVEPDNTVMRKMVEALGYRFTGTWENRLVGLLDL